MSSRLIAGLVALGIVCAAAGPSVAEQPVDPKGHVNWQMPNESEAADLALMARMDGTSLEQAAQQRKVEARLTALVEALEAERPGSIISSIVPTPGNPGVVYIKGELTPRQRTMAASGEFLIVDRLPFSMAEVQDRVGRVAAALYAAGVPEVSASGSADGTRILVAVTEGTLTRAALFEALPDDLANSVDFTLQERVTGAQETVNGGHSVLGPPECTSGFTTVTGTTTGTTTAGHCSNTANSVYPPSGGVSLVVGGTHQGAYGDVAWLSTADVENANFYASPTEVRQVNAVQTSMSLGPQCAFMGRRRGNAAVDTLSARLWSACSSTIWS